ncbi:MAG: hypothetical protein HN465_03600 [Nitrospina sp.]|nr:hypothetical protein [Nitrospina sp.]
MIFIGLGDNLLQVDEGNDTFISTNILKFGFPTHSDGVNYTLLWASSHDGLFVYRPWIPYYIQAFSLSLFGQTTFAARLPFALCGVLSVIFLYRFALKFTGRQFIAFLAALLLASSIPALIYFRTARYVGLPIFLSILLLSFYIKIYKNKKWNPFPLTVVSIIFFHTMYVEFAGMILGVLIHFFIYYKDALPENRQRAAWAAGITGVFCIPWFIFISPMFSKVTQHLASWSTLIDLSWHGYIKRFLGFLFQVNNYIFPIILLPLFFLRQFRPFTKQVSLLLLCILTVLLTALPHAMPIQQYISASFPLFFLLLAILIVNIFPKYLLAQSLLVTFLITSNLVHVFLFFPLKQVVKGHPEWFQKSPYLKNTFNSLMREIKFRSVYFDYIYEISHDYRGPLDEIVAFFKVHGKSGESCYIDNEPESLVYYTRMKVIHRDDIKAQDAPDWIVLRGDYRESVKENSSSKTAQNLREVLRKNPYSKIELNSPSMRVNNTYDIQIHLFRSPSSANTDKITIYKLTNHSSIY